MYQLRSLVWKAYKLRLRSPLSTTLDVGGPISLMIVYLILKLIISTNSTTDLASIPSANETISKPIDNQQNLKNLICPKVLFFAHTTANDNQSKNNNSALRQSISQECGLELIDTASRNDLLDRLRQSLSNRINYADKSVNLNRGNESSSSCFKVPSNKPNGSGSFELSYQIGIIVASRQSIEVHSTEALSIPVIYQPYSLGSTYNEFRLPHGDLNSGLHLLEICLARAMNRNPPSSQDKLINTLAGLKINIGAFPITADCTVLPTLFLVFQLAGNLCNALATVMRTADDNEMGLHHYIRLAGVPSGIYWTSQMIVIVIHMALQSLVFAVLTAIPIGAYVLADPIYELGMTMRWALILSYALAINAHALFVGSMFERTSHAVLVTCLLAISYAMYPIIFMLQWNPYGFSKYGILTDLAMLNPASNYQALLEVMYAAYFRTNEPFDWTKLGMSIDGGGMSDWSVGSLWLLLVGQIIFWFLATILYDHYYYSSSNSVIGYLFTLVNDLIFCNFLAPRSDNSNRSSKTKSSLAPMKAAGGVVLSNDSNLLNPNRVCCSMRHVSVTGPKTLVAHTKGNPLKLSTDQLRRLQQINNTNQEGGETGENHEKALKSQQYIVKRSSSAKPNTAAQYRASSSARSDGTQEEPIVLDEILQQHIIWHKTSIHFDDLNLDFKFNQVSFILGQTDYKELFFQTLLGMRALNGGRVTIDGTEYGPSTLSMARPQIGFLGERDIFLNEMTIFENLQFFGSLRDSSYNQYDSESQFILSLLHLTSRKDNLPVLLTNRSARKLALAAASVGHTKLLLLVEPTLSLRWKPRCQVLNLLKKYKSIRSIIVDTSDVDEATAVGDRIVLFRSSAAYLDGSPNKLAKNLSCGHWIVFEPAASSGVESHPSNTSTISTDNFKSLEVLTSEIFKQDKLDKLDATQRSVYEELMKSTIKESGSKVAAQADMNTIERKRDQHLPLRTIVILKVQHSQNSNQSLCNLLRTFLANKNRSVYGFKLAEVTYESLEDVLVMNMAKALYPDLPPDLLLSLQHRTQINADNDRSQVSVRRYPSDDNANRIETSKPAKSIYVSSVRSIMRDRYLGRPELYYYIAAFALAVGWVIGALLLLQYSVLSGAPESFAARADTSSISVQAPATVHEQQQRHQHLKVDDFYRQRVALYIKGGGSAAATVRNASGQDYIFLWKGSKQFTGIIPDNVSRIDGAYVASLVQRTRDQAVAVIVHEPQANEATIYFEPHQPRAMMAGLKILIDYYRSLNLAATPRGDYQISQQPTGRQDSNSPGGGGGNLNIDQTLHISQHYFQQSWHEIIRGYLNRRLAYGLGFAIAEGISIAVLILAPLRHRAESKVITAKIVYWLAMLLFDMTLSLFQVICYVLAITIIDGTTQSLLVLSNLLVLLLFRLVMAPVAYLVSLIIISRVNGFFFILLLNASIGWAFSIHMRTLVEWSLISEGYLYTIANWIILSMPISSLIDSLTVINHIGRVDHLCSQVPAYTPTGNLVDLEGPQRINVVDKLLSKVTECLKGGKDGTSTWVLHPTKFGVIYDIYFMLLFGVVIWIFLLFSERVFGILARRFSSARSTSDPLKAIIRSTEPTHSLFKWDREKDRLVSEYIRCMNEPAYVKTMATNCVYIRIWLKPLSDQSSIDKRLALILEPLGLLGQPRNDIQIELKTTLQVFVRVGSETNRHRMDRVQLIETYIKFVKEHSDMMMKFALLDWTRETLYKILLHGHYNTKSTSAVT